MANNNQNRPANAQQSSPETPAEATATPSTTLVTRDHMMHVIGRPTPWIHARLDELKAPIALSLNEVEYFDVQWLDRMREVSEQWAEKIRLAKREAVAMGE